MAKNIRDSNKLPSPQDIEIPEDDGFSSISANSGPTNTTNWNNLLTRGGNTGVSGDSLKILENGLAVQNQGNDFSNGIYHSHNIFRPDEIDVFSKRYRNGLTNPYDTVSTTKEFLFFTKPDLNIYPKNIGDVFDGVPASTLNPGLIGETFWKELERKYRKVIETLEKSLNTLDPFNHLLENMVQSNLDVPSLSSDMIDTPENMYGVSFQYHGSSESSDDGYDFSLEFKDTKELYVYQFFKAYEEYQKLKSHGVIKMDKIQVMNKILHDQYSIYKFIVSEDNETILYYCKYYAVMSKSLPRDVFSNTSFDNGLSYSIDFHAAFFDDMKPVILTDFNNLSRNAFNNCKYQYSQWNTYLDRPDNRPAKAALVVKDTTSVAAKKAPGGYLYKLKWRGDDVS